MIIAFRDGTNITPTLDVEDNGVDQVVIRFIPYKGEHITLHLNKDGSIIRTHYKEDKEKSTWDEARVQIAAAMGNPHPERHGNYIINTPLPKIDNLDGYFLGGRLIDLSSFIPRTRYSNKITKIIDANSSKFMLQSYLSTKDEPRQTSLNRIATSLGDICFELEPR